MMSLSVAGSTTARSSWNQLHAPLSLILMAAA
jgi:hypothetical protein